MTPRAYPLALLALLLGCRHPPPPRPPEEIEREALVPEVQALSVQAQKLLRTQEELIWRGWTEGKQIELAKTYEGKRALFSTSSIKKIDRLRRLVSDPIELKALTNLYVHFVGEHLSFGLSELEEALANHEASLTFSFDGKDVVLKDLDRMLANEKVASRRQALYEAATPAILRLAETYRLRDERLQRMITELGYPSSEVFGAELRQVDLDWMELAAEEVLQVTQPAYVATMRKLSELELGMPFDRARRWDLPRLFHPPNLDASFPKELVLTRAQQTTARMGIDLPHLSCLTIDAKDTAAKNPRPLAIAIDVPDDVRLSVKPSGGLRDQVATLHEVGVALHYCFTQAHRFELGKLGGGTSSEAQGDLFDELTEDPVWLTEQVALPQDKLEGHLFAQAAHDLYLARRAAGRLLYQLRLSRRTTEDPAALYAQTMSRAYQVPLLGPDLARFRMEEDPFFTSADRLRAWFLAAQIQGQLKARFGPSWWQKKEAGDFIKTLWARGNAASAAQIAEAAGDHAFKPDAFLLRIGANLKQPMPLAPAPAPEPPASPDAGHL